MGICLKRGQVLNKNQEEHTYVKHFGFPSDILEYFRSFLLLLL